MKTPRIFPVLMLVATTASGQLQTPAADRLTDYLNWFAPLTPTAGDFAPGLQSPGSAQIDNSNRNWTTWLPNSAPGLQGPIVGVPSGLFCEVVFLGETGDCWGSFGLRLNGVDTALSLSPDQRQFGHYALPLPTEQDNLDFFVERSDGARYYAFDKALNSPAAPSTDGYFGTLTPLSSVRGPEGFGSEDGTIPFTVLAFEHDLAGSTTAPAVFVFAVRGGFDMPTGVPEPSTYGLAAAAALLALIVRRRRRSSRPPVSAT